MIVALDYDPIGAVALLVAGAILVDSILQGTAVRLLLNTTIVLAVISVGVLVYEFFWQVALIAVALIAVVILLENLRELRGR